MTFKEDIIRLVRAVSKHERALAEFDKWQLVRDHEQIAVAAGEMEEIYKELKEKYERQT